MTLVIDFSEGRGRVSRSHESLGQGYGVWNSRPEFGFQIVNPNRVRAQTCHQGIAGGRAYRLIAVGAIKKRRAGGEFINVRGLHLAVSVASEKGLEVIHANQKDIWLLGPECRGRKCKKHQERKPQGIVHSRVMIKKVPPINIFCGGRNATLLVAV
jgi:hypothetical protein